MMCCKANFQTCWPPGTLVYEEMVYSTERVLLDMDIPTPRPGRVVVGAVDKEVRTPFGPRTTVFSPGE